MTLSKHRLIYRPYMINFLLLKMSLAIVIAKGGLGGGRGGRERERCGCRQTHLQVQRMTRSQDHAGQRTTL